MIIRHRGQSPDIDETAYIAPNATIAGNVSIGKHSRIMFGAVLSAESSRIAIGEKTVVCENAVIRASAAGPVDQPVGIGSHVFISPQATLIGCKIEDHAYIATGATVLQGALVHATAVVAVGALVHAGTVIPAGYFVAPNTIAIGDPVKIYSPDEKETLVAAIRALKFTQTAFGMDPDKSDRKAVMTGVTETRTREFAAHFIDEILG